MAAGKLSSYRVNEFRDREYDSIVSRRDFYHSKKNEYHPHRSREYHRGYDYHHDSRSDRRNEEVGRDKYTIKQKENRKKEEADGGRGQYKKKSPDSVLDEISGGSGSDRSVLSSSVKEVSLSETEDNEAAPLPSRKKRKLSPILCHRKEEEINGKSKNAFVSNILSNSLFADNCFLQSSRGASACEHKSSPTSVGPFSLNKHSPPKDLSGSLGSSVVSPPLFWKGSIRSSVVSHPPFWQGSSYQEPGKMEGNDGFLSNKKIPASRWADEEEGEISEEEGINERETSLPSCGSSEFHAEFGMNEDDENSDGPTYGYDSDLEEENDYVAALYQQRTINMLQSCRSVGEYEKLNKIGAGTYGIVHLARDKRSGELVALKEVKMEKEREGFPITALREINILLSSRHPSIVDVKEVVVKEDAVEGKNRTYLVMEYMEHDLKGVIERMKYPFSLSEVKCLMLQLLEGVKFLHDNWVLHRDLKTSNILYSNCGQLKICDFGMSRQYGSPLKPYTPLVVSLWYRAPELLLDVKQYSTAVDMWSVGCIMAELLAKKPLFMGESELDQLKKIFEILGTPDETTWPGFSELPGFKVNFARKKCSLREKFPPKSFTGSPILSSAGYDLLSRLLAHDPKRRISAEEAVNHEWFREFPLPKEKEFMPTFPVKHAKAGY